ncbi:MAG: permease [Bdellovibrionales bacterium]|nr:permease [Bdellovibrionales bacterium]
MADHCCPTPSQKKKPDFLFWGSLSVVTIGYILFLFPIGDQHGWFSHFTHSVFELMNKMWIGLVLGIFFVGVLGKIPREFVISVIGKPGTFTGILRATLAGLLLDLCSHGILLVGLKLYERGASIGQTMAFLIASPWNSLTLTIILMTLIGWKATLVFILLSAVIAIVSGVIFDHFEKTKTLPQNPNKVELPENFSFWNEAKINLSKTKMNFSFFSSIAKEGFKDSKMILKWIFVGVALASFIRVLVPADLYQSLFGPTLKGLGLTLGFATIIEVCSEGLAPVAADLVTRAKALGNGFAFLMAGVSTDYTEIMGLKERTKSWKIALFLPLVTIPQILILGYLLNKFF